MKKILNDPQVVCIREISKKFEEVKKGKAGELLQHFEIHRPRGEFVVLLGREGVLQDSFKGALIEGGCQPAATGLRTGTVSGNINDTGAFADIARSV